MSEALEMRCKDDPEAGGRVAIKGDRRYTLTFPLEDGRDLRLHMSREGMNHFAGMIAEMMADDAEEGESGF